MKSFWEPFTQWLCNILIDSQSMTDLSESDTALVYRSRDGDLAAFRTLVETYQHKVLRISYRISGDFHGAEDIAQESFIRAFEKLDTFDPDKGKFSSWLFQITKNLSLNARRKIIPLPCEAAGETQSDDSLSPSSTSEQRDTARRWGIRFFPVA